MKLEIQQMIQVDAEAIAAWRYQGDYSFYDADADADDLALLLSGEIRENRYFSAFAGDELVGFFEFKVSGSTVEIGLGLRPDHTGRGLGVAFVEEGLASARARYALCEFRLSVATFNQRAIHVHERAGFVPVRTYVHVTAGSVYPFLEMTRSATDG